MEAATGVHRARSYPMPRVNVATLTKAALIDEFGDKLSPARAEALLDEFEHDINAAFLRRDMSAAIAHCDTYARRFRVLGEEKD